MFVSDIQHILQCIAYKDELSFKQLYDRYSKKVYSQSLRVLANDSQAEEAVQEIFLKIWLMGIKLLAIENFDAYIRTSTRNHCLNIIRQTVSDRKKTAYLTENYDESHNETEEKILLKDKRAYLDSVVQTLPTQQRQVFQLCHYEGLKYEETAEIMNISVNTVKTHMKRALTHLRQHIGGEYPLVLMILFKLL